MPIDDQLLLNMLLFNVRAGLTELFGSAKLAEHYQQEIPAETLAWIQKWTRAAEAWLEIEQQARPYAYESYDTPPDWDQIVANVSKGLTNTSEAYSEAQTLPMPQRSDAKHAVDMALRAILNLNEMGRLMRTGEYKNQYDSSG